MSLGKQEGLEGKNRMGKDERIDKKNRASMAGPV